MSGPYCETCKYFYSSPFSEVEGECTDPSKLIYVRGGMRFNEIPTTMIKNECSNHKDINIKESNNE